MNRPMSPPKDPRPIRHDWRLTFLLGLGCTIFYAGFTQASFKGIDEVGVFQVTEALYLDCSLAVPIHHHAHLGADGRLYHAWATGQSVLALPFYALSQLASPRPGSMLLVHSAAGGVGGALLQLARRADCRTVGVVGAAHKVEAARALGASEVIDKSTEDLWEAARRHAPDGYQAQRSYSIASSPVMKR